MQMNSDHGSPLPRARSAAIILIFWAILLAGCQRERELSRTPHILVNSEDDPRALMARGLHSNQINVMYVTDRQRELGKDEKVVYGCGRSKSMAYGDCVVEIGRGRGRRLDLGSVRELGRFPKTPFPLARGEADEAPDDPEALRAQAAMTRAYQDELAARVAASPRKEVLIFVHGYNVTFGSAVTTLAEVHNYLGREGVPICYTWPAGASGLLRGYTRDRESGEFTNFHFKQFLKMTASIPGVERINILCHSRGTDVVTTALRELFGESRSAGRNPKEDYKIAHLAMAAPDMDFEVVSQRVMAERIPMGVGRTTLYVSPYDRALGLADWLFRGISRLGRLGAEDLTAEMRKNMACFGELDVIQVRIKCKHSYFYSNPSVSSDLILLIREDCPPGIENGRPLKPLAPGFWALYRGYPADIKLPLLRRWRVSDFTFNSEIVPAPAEALEPASRENDLMSAGVGDRLHVGRLCKPTP